MTRLTRQSLIVWSLPPIDSPPEFLYAINRCRQQAIDDPSSITTKEYWERHDVARAKYRKTDDETKTLWSLRSRQHLHRQPNIKDLIMAALDVNPKRSWLGLEHDIEYWCSATTIRKWLVHQETFSYYAERILPNLLPHQKVKHKEFAHLFRNNWGMGGGKYLLIEFDEKWM